MFHMPPLALKMMGETIIKDPILACTGKLVDDKPNPHYQHASQCLQLHFLCITAPFLFVDKITWSFDISKRLFRTSGPFQNVFAFFYPESLLFISSII